MRGGLEPKGVCQRCGFTYPLSKLRKEWDGLRVCPDDYDPRPAEMRAPRYKPEGLVVPNASPLPDYVFGRIAPPIFGKSSQPATVGGDDDFLIFMDDFSL